MTSIRLDDLERAEAAQIYRAIADGEGSEQLLQRFYDFLGDAAELRPPHMEIRLSNLCGTRQDAAHG
ncbi:hypothetical protein [Rhizobium wuzhouense]|uniref:hypothetical protein n=1 Tax=Rhizobium wuzhouense TaxID=1986026 RepID=UPI001403F4A4|nr:hypothetical protein [Rhizobium wuzhouense]